METESQNVVRFLEALQNSRDRLREVLCNQLILKGASSATPFLVLSGRPFKIHNANSVREFSGSIALGVHAKPKTGDAIEFGIDVLWNESGWLIIAEIYVESDDKQILLQSFPEKHVSSLDDCLKQLEVTISELLVCAETINETQFTKKHPKK